MRAKGITSRYIAGELGWSETTVSRVLTGKGVVSPVNLAALLALCGITGARRDRLLTLAGDVPEVGWCEEHGVCLPAGLSAVRELERTATTVTCVDTVAVPALVQTEDYRRALLHINPVIPDEEIEHRLTCHRARQNLLDRDGPPSVRLFIAEQVLTRPGTDRDVLCDQLHYLLRMAVRPQVEIRVLLANCTLLDVCASFQLMTFSDLRPVVYLEQFNSTALLDQPATIASYERLLVQLDSAALDAELSRTRLAAIAVALSEPADHPEVPCDGWLGRLLEGRNQAGM